ncbi:hypothetical protein GCM10027347_19910 [Larkinella harenae]
MPTPFQRLPFVLLLVATFQIQSCRLSEIGVSDSPPSDRSQLKGPDAQTLERKTVQLTELLAYPFYGGSVQFNQQLLLQGYNDDAGRLAVLNPAGIRELPKNTFTHLFATPSGITWGAKVLTNAFSLHQLNNGRWIEEGLLKGNLYQTVRVTDQQIWLMTSKSLLIWDIKQKKVSQQLDLDPSRRFTDNFSLEIVKGELRIYRNQTLTTAIARFSLASLLTVRAGISNAIWNAFEDPNGGLWLVVKDANWDGILFRYDGQNLTKLTTIPVGQHDSGRGVSHCIFDKHGNLWMSVDRVNYVYTKEGKWLLPEFDLLKNTPHGSSVFTDSKGNLIVASYPKLFSMRP